MTAPAPPGDGPPIVRVTAPTEARNPATTGLDTLPTLDLLYAINDADRTVPAAVRAVLPALAGAVDRAVAALAAGRRVHYFGAGTSGRLGVLDAAELIPTYALAPGVVVAHHAGGVPALTTAIEGVEDDAAGGAAEAAASVAAGDVVVGLTASGRTPYVLGALRAARSQGAGTVLVAADPHAAAAREVDVFIGVDTGPEVVTGSTRMKAGTAEKLLLNAFSTAMMVRLGHTYSNLMVDLVATNAKLRGRVRAILGEVTGLSGVAAEQALAAAGGDLKVAIVAALAGVPPERASTALSAAGGHARSAVAALAGAAR